MTRFVRSSLGSVLLFGAVRLVAQPRPVGSDFRVNSYTTSNQEAPDVAGHNTGFVVVWSGRGATDADGIFGQRYDLSGPVGSEFRVNSTTTGNQGPASVANTATRAFVVAWQSPDGDGYGVFAQRYDSTGQAAGTEFRVNTYTTATQNGHDVSMNPNTGDFVIVWRRAADGAAPDAIAAQRYDAAGVPLGLNFRVNTYTTGSREYPVAAVTKFGDFLVVWSGQGATDTEGIFAQRYDSAGNPQGSEFRVNTYTTDAQRKPAVAVDATGTYLVVWEDRNVRSQIFAQRLALDGSPLGGEFRVDSGTTLYHVQPVVTANFSGSFVISWRFGNYGPYGGQYGPDEIFTRRAVQSAVKGPEIRVNSNTSGFRRLTPSVATVGARSFVVVWAADPDPGENLNVFARHLCLPKGDVNFDGTIDVLDVFYLINRLFAAGPAPLDSGDANGDTSTDVLDVFHLINFMFAGGPSPVCS
jgi:hypothetical protein